MSFSPYPLARMLLPDIFTSTGKFLPTASLTRASTSRGKRNLFSWLPPYSSVRWFVSPDRNRDSR